MKKLGDIWQHYANLEAIVAESNGSEKYLKLDEITNQTSRHL
jgi:hypothetical protein